MSSVGRKIWPSRKVLDGGRGSDSGPKLGGLSPWKRAATEKAQARKRDLPAEFGGGLGRDGSEMGCRIVSALEKSCGENLQGLQAEVAALREDKKEAEAQRAMVWDKVCHLEG
jgi:hypothetical protein